MSAKLAVGYIRVSTVSQAEKGQSLRTQQKAIENYCRKENLTLLEVYRDEGISGGTVSDRPALLRLLNDINDVDYVIVHRLSRLGRNVRELLNNIDFIQKAKVEVVFEKESLDLSTPHGKLMLQLLGAIAEFEKDITRESSLENKIARCRTGIPATGKTPFGRGYNRDTGEWYYDPPDITKVFQEIAERYLKGESLRTIASTIPKSYHLSYSNILKVIHNSAGSTWQVQFKDLEEPIVYEIPPLLDDKTLDQVKQRLSFNNKFNRHDVREKYILSGFIRCGKCGKALSGQVQRYKETKHKYYVHPGSKWEKCKALSSIKAEKIEEAVFEAIFENAFDEDGFEEAIKDNFPDPKEREILEGEVGVLEKKVNRINRDQDKLLDALLAETLSHDVIKKRDLQLKNEKQVLENELAKKKDILKKMVSKSERKELSDMLRYEIMSYFGSEV